MATTQQAVSNGHAEPEISSEPLLLFNWVCPYVHRVTLALGHKKAHIRSIDIDLLNKPSWLTKYSPLGKVPAVTYTQGGEQQVLYESLVLLQWVNEYFEGPELLPGTPAERAKARIIIARFDSNFPSAWYTAVRTSDPQEFKALWDKLQGELAWLEQNIHPTGPFLTGSQPSLVDAAVAPWLLRLPVLQHLRGVDVLEGHSRLIAFLDAYKALPEVAATLKAPEHDAGHEQWSQGIVDRFSTFVGPKSDFSAVVAAA